VRFFGWLVENGAVSRIASHPSWLDTASLVLTGVLHSETRNVRATRLRSEGAAMPNPVLADSGVTIAIGGVLYFILLVTLGFISLRKGHWVMFIIGIFFPLFWLIGAIIPRR
jgi:hypothetical protein